jgi:hypothetical protein
MLAAVDLDQLTNAAPLVNLRWPLLAWHQQAASVMRLRTPVPMTDYILAG